MAKSIVDKDQTVCYNVLYKHMSYYIEIQFARLLQRGFSQTLKELKFEIELTHNSQETVALAF